MKALVEDWRQRRGEKRSLEKDYHARLKEACEERQTLKIELTEENRLLRKSYNAEVKKQGLLEVKSVRDNDKITNLKRTRERQAPNFIIDDAMVEARRLSADALEMMAKGNDTIITERERLQPGFTKSVLITQESLRGYGKCKQCQLRSLSMTKHHWFSQYNPSVMQNIIKCERMLQMCP